MAVSHLRSFQALELALRMGSLRAAADALWVTPAAVGQRIKVLEDYLGVDLLVRGRSGLKPTPELAGALTHLRAAFEELDAAANVLNLQRGDQIHVAATSDFVDLWLRPRLEAFVAEHPQIRFCINGEGDAPLRIGPVDCEIRFGAAAQESGVDGLFGDFVVPISSAENARRLSRLDLEPRARLEGFPLLHVDFYKDDPGVPNWRAWTAKHRLRRSEPDRGMRFQRILPALEAVAANSGVALCGLALLAAHIERGDLAFPFPIETGHWCSRAFQARFRPDALARPQVRGFRQWLLSEAADTRQWLAAFAAGGGSRKRRRSARAV